MSPAESKGPPADATVFAGKPLVVKIGGATLEAQREHPTLWRALLAMHERHAGGVVLVHGGGKAVDRLLDKLGMKTERREGIRITPPEQMDVIAGVLAGSVNKSLVGAINAAGAGRARAVGLCLGDGTGIRTRRTTKLGFDPGCVGEVDTDAAQPSTGLLRELLRLKFLPVVACIGIDDTGGLLNINGDDAAAGIARVLGASALVLLTDVPGVKGADDKVVPELSAAQAASLIKDGVISGGMVPKVRSALETAGATGAPVVILSGEPAHFEAYLRGEPVGTRILPT